LLRIGGTGEQSKDRKGAAGPSGGFELVIAAVLQNSGFHPAQSGVVNATRPAVESLEACPAVTQTVGSLGPGRGVGAAAEAGQQVGGMGRGSKASLSGMSQQGRQVAVYLPGIELSAANEGQPVQQRGGVDGLIGKKAAGAAVTPRQEVEAEQLRQLQPVARVAEDRVFQPAEYNMLPQAQGEAPGAGMRPGEPAPENAAGREAWQQADRAPQTPILRVDAAVGDSVRIAWTAEGRGSAEGSQPVGPVPGIVESAEGTEKGRAATTEGQPEEMGEAADRPGRTPVQQHRADAGRRPEAVSHGVRLQREAVPGQAWWGRGAVEQAQRGPEGTRVRPGQTAPESQAGREVSQQADRAPQTATVQIDATAGDSVRVAWTAEAPGSQPVGMGPATVASGEGNPQGVGEAADTARQVLVQEAEQGPQGRGVTPRQPALENEAGRAAWREAGQVRQTPTLQIDAMPGDSVRVAWTAEGRSSAQGSESAGTAPGTVASGEGKTQGVQETADRPSRARVQEHRAGSGGRPAAVSDGVRLQREAIPGEARRGRGVVEQAQDDVVRQGQPGPERTGVRPGQAAPENAAVREVSQQADRAPQTPTLQIDPAAGDSVRVAWMAEARSSQPVDIGPATGAGADGKAQGVQQTADTSGRVLAREAEQEPERRGVTPRQAPAENVAVRGVSRQADRAPQTPTVQMDATAGDSVRVAGTAQPLGSEQDSKPVNPAVRQAVDASGQEAVSQAQPGAEQLAARTEGTAPENEPGRENMRKGPQEPQAPLSRPRTEPGNSGQIAHAPTEASTATEAVGPRQAGLEEALEPGQALKAVRPAEGVAERWTQVTSAGAASPSEESTGTEVAAKSEEAASKVRGGQIKAKGGSEKAPQVIVTDLGLGKLAPGGQARLANGPGSAGGIAEAAQVAHSGQQQVTSAQYQVIVEVEEGQLGPLRLEVEMDGETVRAVVMTDSVDARKLVRSCEAAIRAALEQHNLRVDSFEVEQTTTSTRDLAGTGGQNARAGGQSAGAGPGSGGLTREAATAWPSELVSTRNQTEAEVAREWGSGWEHVGLVDLVA